MYHVCFLCWIEYCRPLFSHDSEYQNKGTTCDSVILNIKKIDIFIDIHIFSFYIPTTSLVFTSNQFITKTRKMLDITSFIINWHFNEVSFLCFLELGKKLTSDKKINFKLMISHIFLVGACIMAIYTYCFVLGVVLNIIYFFGSLQR